MCLNFPFPKHIPPSSQQRITRTNWQMHFYSMLNFFYTLSGTTGLSYIFNNQNYIVITTVFFFLFKEIPVSNNLLILLTLMTFSNLNDFILQFYLHATYKSILQKHYLLSVPNFHRTDWKT